MYGRQSKDCLFSYKYYEREDLSMKKKGNFRKVVSGLLAGMTMLSTVLSPMPAYAAEIQPEEKPPLYA